MTPDDAITYARTVLVMFEVDFPIWACVCTSLHTHVVPLKIIVHETADGSERPRSHVAWSAH